MLVEEHKQSFDEDDFLCAICLSCLESPAKLICDHVFCGSCLDAWRERCVSVGQFIKPSGAEQHGESRKGVECPKCRAVTPVPQIVKLEITMTL